MKLAFALLSLFCVVHSTEVYLREITIYTTHESGLIPRNTPEVYFICDDDRQAIMLRDVTETEKKYVFNPYQLPAANLEEGQCVVCTLKEYDLFKDDDVFGTMKLCLNSFSTGASQVRRKGEYLIRFECPQCIHKEKKHPNKKEKQHVECPTVAVQAQAQSNAITYKQDTSHPAEANTTSGKKETSTGMLVMTTLMGFAVGVVAGIVSLKYFSTFRRQREAERMRELNAILQQEIPFEALPKPVATKTTTVKSEGVVYSQIPSENREENA